LTLREVRRIIDSGSVCFGSFNINEMLQYVTIRQRLNSL
jgi:hypothetical protein